MGNKKMTILKVQDWGLQPYTTMCDEMQRYTTSRDVLSRDQLWLVQHPAVYTLGTAAKREHLLRETAIPIVQCNRGGQVTYHGLGQQIFYVLLDLKRKGLTVRQLVSGLEQVMINVLAHYSVAAYSSKTAPGVYIDGRKISSLGLKIQQGRSFHGIALNISMDLSPFNDINPCGYKGLEVVNLSDFVAEISNKDVCQQFIKLFCDHFDYRVEER